MLSFLQFLQEKYNNDIDTITEMTSSQFIGLSRLLSKLFSSYNLKFVITTHNNDQFTRNPDESRTSMDAANVYETMVKFCEKQKVAFEKYKKRQVEYIAVITNTTTNLNIVVSIDYHDKRIRPYQQNNLKIITGMVKKDFGSDSYPTSVRVYVD